MVDGEFPVGGVGPDYSDGSMYTEDTDGAWAPTAGTVRFQTGDTNGVQAPTAQTGTSQTEDRDGVLVPSHETVSAVGRHSRTQGTDCLDGGGSVEALTAKTVASQSRHRQLRRW